MFYFRGGAGFVVSGGGERRFGFLEVGNGENQVKKVRFLWRCKSACFRKCVEKLCFIA